MAKTLQRDERGEREHGLFVEVLRGLVRDHSFHYAAGTAFRVMLAVFPLLVGLLTLASITGSADRMDHVLQAVGRTDAVPGRTIEALRGQLDELDEPGSSLVLGTIIAFALAIWSSAGAFRTVMSGLNEIFDIHDRGGLVRKFFVSVALAVVTATLATVATFLAAEGPVVEEFVESLPGASGPLEEVWNVLRFPVMAMLVFAWLSITYAFGPADRRDFRFITPGIVIAFLAWLAFALLFSAYVDSRSGQEETYGAFAGLVVFQLYMYWSALIVFVGAQVDSALGRRGR